jgi:polyribonucleotide nucleotidyltransferase
MLRSIRRAPLHAQLIRRLAVTDKLRVKSRLIGAPRRKLSSFEAISGRHNESVKQTTLSFYSKGVIGHLAEASAVCANGGSVVHATVCSARTASPTDDFLPLTVDYRSRAYAFGRMPQSNGRRERHGTDDEILVARIIDRAIRPLFPKGYVHEVQLTVTAHAADGINDPTIAAVNAASFTLMKSKQPWNGPIGCVRVGLIDGKLVVNPSVDDLEKSEMDLVYAGNSSRPVM